MSIFYSKSAAKSTGQARILANQYKNTQLIREKSEGTQGSVVTLIELIANNDMDFAKSDLAKSVLANNARSPFDAYLEFDKSTVLERVENGQGSTVSRLMEFSKSIDIGKQVFEYRQSTIAGTARTSMSGSIGILADSVDYTSAKSLIPIHDVGIQREWREVAGMKSDGFDAIVDDLAEAEKTLIKKISSYLFNGTEISVNGAVWKGLRGDRSVEQVVLAVDLSSSATTSDEIRSEFIRVRDILSIDNNCDGDLSFGVSKEVMSNMERFFSATDSGFGTIADVLAKLSGIKEIYIDSELSGNELIAYHPGYTSLHPVVGSAIATYPVPRNIHNDPFGFIKWAAVGFISRVTNSGKKCALYAKGV